MPLKLVQGRSCHSTLERSPRCTQEAFFSKNLTPTEQNYDIGNRELLAVTLALEEWCNLLEGTRFPFAIFIDHKNLGYLKKNVIKLLNPHQAQWALFNTKADTLSHLYPTESTEGEHDPTCKLLHQGPYLGN